MSKVYCKDCRFLRVRANEETEEPVTFIRIGEKPMEHRCVHPKNITRAESYLEYHGWTCIKHPSVLNCDNACDGFEAANKVLEEFAELQEEEEDV